MKKGQGSVGKAETWFPVEKGEKKWLVSKNQPGGMT